jgi:hypothetical protein
MQVDAVAASTSRGCFSQDNGSAAGIVWLALFDWHGLTDSIADEFHRKSG